MCHTLPIILVMLLPQTLTLNSTCQYPDRIREVVRAGTQWSPVNRTWTVFVTPAAGPCEASDKLDTSWTGYNSSWIIIQDGDILRISLDSSDPATNDTTDLKVSLYLTSEEHFAASGCNTSRILGQALGEVTTSKEFTLQRQHISLGHALILGGCLKGHAQISSNICLKLNITMKWTKCFKSGGGIPCTGTGACIANSTEVAFGCKCCTGYTGSFCEEKDACNGNPCRNGGFCIDITEGHDGDTFQCLCPYGFSGRTCEQVTYKCDSTPCKNNGSCLGNQTSFTCICTPGFMGRLCEMNVDECASNPCLHGICVDGEDGYQCFCAPGYGGVNCEFEYKECDSSPCINNGRCIEKVNTYTCQCGPGYTGNRCHIKVDLCNTKPCPYGTRCLDRGNNVTCECDPDISGSACLVSTCSPTTCKNGGTCRKSASSSVHCLCSPGFAGDDCQESIQFLPNPTLPEQHIDLDIPASVHVDHLHNIYIAMGTLSCALLIVIATVTFCHCRVHKTYQKFACRCRRSSTCSRIGDCRGYCDYRDQISDKGSLSSERERTGKLPPPTLDALFESCSGLDFTDNMEAPLINLALK